MITFSFSKITSKARFWWFQKYFVGNNFFLFCQNLNQFPDQQDKTNKKIDFSSLHKVQLNIHLHFKGVHFKFMEGDSFWFWRSSKNVFWWSKTHFSDLRTVCTINLSLQLSLYFLTYGGNKFLSHRWPSTILRVWDFSFYMLNFQI